MTYQTILAKIDRAAELGAQSSLDAHGEFVAPEIVWDFLRGSFADDDLMDGLPDAMPRKFADDYREHCKRLAGGAK